MDIRIPLSDMDYGPEEERAALEVIHRRWLTMGAVTQEFERGFADFVGAKHALAVSSCTDALHLACLALGIGEGDEVIAPSLTFVATTNAILYTRAEVRFADILGETDLTISPEEIEKRITPRTKAIMVMHYGGYPCHMTEIMKIARNHGLAVIEDAAHAPGAAYNERSLGTWGDVGCFSFFSNKNLATGEGGMLVTERDDIAEKVKLLRSHGMTTLTWDRHRGHASKYDVLDLGHNYRIDEIRAALGLVQLRKLTGNNARRKRITEQYRQALGEFMSWGVELPFLDAGGQPAYHIFPLLLPPSVERQLFMEGMRKRGIQTSVHYPPIHKFSYYQQRYPGVSLPVTESIASREVTLPLYPGMTDKDVEDVLGAMSEVLRTIQMENNREHIIV
jgi:dTDP-4-amino-4,6-dideoxygalactose transaminase